MVVSVLVTITDMAIPRIMASSDIEGDFTVRKTQLESFKNSIITVKEHINDLSALVVLTKDHCGEVRTWFTGDIHQIYGMIKHAERKVEEEL